MTGKFDDLHGIFGEPEEPRTLDEVLERISRLELDIQSQLDRIYYALFPMFGLLAYIAYKIS